MTVTTPPDFLSHYTTLEGLKGIVQSRSLWASNASFLNDKAELLHALHESKNVIERLSSKEDFDQWRDDIETIFKDFTSKGIPDTYVICFCDNDDNLSQWRGYGGAVQGISLNFSRKWLMTRLRNEKASLARVFYTKRSTAKKMSEELTRELEDIVELDDLIGFTPEQRADELRERVSKLLPRFKHLGFADEKEWRFIIQRAIDPSKLCFRVSNNKLVPYVEIGKGDDMLPIASVSVGPGPDQELTSQSVKFFLRAHGYNVPVDSSDIPFRA